jgi:thiamine-monophosphate kinase
VKNTPISSVGEFGLIGRLKKKCLDLHLPQKITDQIVLGIDDDTAVTRPNPGMLQLSTSDLLIEGVHFDLTYTSMKYLGWKLMVVNLSDIAAMGGVPVYALITIALPAKISLEMVDDLYEGILQAAQTYGCAIIGGDTNTSIGNTMLSATLTGEVPENFLKRRNTAQPGDLICISGPLGLSHAGLRVLLREKKRFVDEIQQEEFTSELGEYTAAVSKHLAPKARFDVSTVAAQQEWVHAMIDISDGLASDLRHICNQSGVGADIFEEKIPIDPVARKIADEFGESPLDYSLFGGEEYELLFTIDPGQEKKLHELVSGISVIGIITEHRGTVKLIQKDGPERTILSGGYDHFKK